MKRILLAMSLAAPMSMVSPAESRAGDEGWAALGGFLVGSILGDVSHHSRGHHRVTHHREVVVHQPTYVYEEPVVRYTYKKIKRQRWIEGYHTYQRLPCGRTVKKWHSGHYETYYETIKVPSYSSGGHHGSSHGTQYRPSSRGSCRY